MRILLTGGGTGGHVYPALAVADELGRMLPPDEDAGTLIYVGSADGMERGIVEQAGLPFRGISAGALRGRTPAGLAVGGARLARGLAQSLGLVGAERPDAVLATGGYVCVPVVLAAWLRRVPVALYLPDVEPGLAVRFLARFSARICVTSGDSRAFFPPGIAGRVVETGYPVRPDVLRAERLASRIRFGLPESATVLLVFGGSRGARTLNEATFGELDALLGLAPDLYVVHVCGRDDETRALERRSALAPSPATRYHPFAYLHSADMAAALRASDLVVSRSGASTMGEFPAVGLPSVQVPYPYAGAHQRRNADYLARRGAAVVLDNESVRGGALVPTLRELLGDRARLAGMADAARKLARPDAAHRIAEQLVALGEKR